MKLPQLNELNDSISMINAFLGVNKQSKIDDSEFSDVTNITNDYFPAIGNRPKRGIIRTLTNPQAIFGGKYLSYVDDNKLYYNENYICDLNETDAERQIVMMGAYLIVFPDGIIVNTATDPMTVETIENEVTTASNPSFTLCRYDGSPYTNLYTGATEPTDHSKYWIDTGADPVVIKMWSTNSSSWVSVGTTYVKVEATGIGIGFKDYDAATFSDVDLPGTRTEIYNNWDFNQSNILYKVTDDYVVIAGLINGTFTNSKPVTIHREMPQMDFVVEQDNRLWGCSSEKHEIYASKLGDPKNWNCFMGLDSDSYAVSVGTQDVFTGAVSYNSTVYFFKENGSHRLYGSKPSNYQLQWKPGRGVQKGSEKSIAVVQEVLFYKARDAICAFNGAIETVSEKLGTEPLYDAVAGSYRDKYYICMRDGNYRFRLYVYDMTKNTWMIEDDNRYQYMTEANGGFYIIDDSHKLSCINREQIYVKWFPSESIYPADDIYPGTSYQGAMENNVEWSFTTGDIGMTDPYYKYVKRYIVRLMLEANAFIRFECSFDSSDDWENVMEYYCTKKRTYSVPLPVKRCDHMRIRVSGYGDFKIYSIAKVVESTDDGI